MSRVRELERGLRSLATLGEAVSALRSLAAQSFREARAQLPHARAYLCEVTELVRASLATQTREASSEASHAVLPPGVLLITADLGLAGDYAARLAVHAAELLRTLESHSLICLGRRGLRRLGDPRITPAAIFPAPTAGRSVAQQLLPVVDRVLELQELGALGALWLVSARFEGAGRFRPEHRRILPLELPAVTTDASSSTPARAGPGVSTYCEAARVRAVAQREFLAATLQDALLEALCSEHGKRLVVAESARSWLAERTTRERRRVSSLRRELATQEVFEIVSASRLTGRAEVSR